MIDNILNALADFRALATLETFVRIFGADDGPRFWGYYKELGRDIIAFYAKNLTEDQQLLFDAFLSAQLPPACYASPTCVECGGPLTESDVEAGEDVCLDCAAALVLNGDIDHEPGSLLARVRVKLDDTHVGGYGDVIE